MTLATFPDRKKCLCSHKLVIIIIIISSSSSSSSSNNSSSSSSSNHYICFKQNFVCPSDFLACCLRHARQSFAPPRQRIRSQDCPTLSSILYALLSSLETRNVVKWHFILRGIRLNRSTCFEHPELVYLGWPTETHRRAT
jgi:hypothetical protein